MCYVARYVVKKQFGVDKLKYNGRCPPFNGSSNRPGLGADYFDLLDLDVDRVSIFDGKDVHAVGVPRIVLEHIKQRDEELYNAIMDTRRYINQGPNGTLPIPPAWFQQTSSTGGGEFSWSGSTFNNGSGSVGFSGNDPSFHGTYTASDGKKYDYVNSTVAGSYNLTQGLIGNLWAYNPGNSGFSISINDLRIATLTQQYYESLARSGSRYEEVLQQFFGVSNPDSRINHPEYLGGNRVRVNVREITNTAQSEVDFLGDLGAQSATADSHFDFVKSFTEPGWLYGFVVLRYDHSYSQSMPAQFTRKHKFDFYNPLFAQIGEQPVYDREIYASKATLENDSIFGYQEAWASYRYGQNRASGFLRANVTGALSHWTLGDNYAQKPVLSDAWIREDKTNLDRALAVTSNLTHQAFADFYFETYWTRPMPMYSVPGAIGAF
ncbi:unnamed protein product [Cylicocyclus nassatus]|uniref:Uncharacterized protein n=1 Tax=Cylicocyclus nassatus TaxID=53992 RepID=A0AA36H3H4_CYLNA|nr:unnamed protein product [Cylicocyclus nassatus]